MRSIVQSLICLLLLMAPAMAMGQASGAAAPRIQGYGAASALPRAAMQPAPDIHYKVVFDVTGFSPLQEEPADGLAHAAKLLNIMKAAHHPLDRLTVEVVIHSDAVYAALSAQAFRKRFGRDNPNTKLIERLSEAGVGIYVCGQTMVQREIAENELDVRSVAVLSAMTSLISYQNQGYAQLDY